MGVLRKSTIGATWEEAMAYSARRYSRLLAILCIVLFPNVAPVMSAVTRQYSFQVQPFSVSRICKTKSLIAVNDMFPGPIVYANEDDTVLVNVTNNCQYNITIHWHGIRQLRSGWADGPVYITQCPMQTGQSYQYNFTVRRQSGTLFWHAHDTWLRGTVYGAMVIFPKQGDSYPFIFPKEEHVLLLGEWYNANVEDIESQFLLSGGGPPFADAYTINGLPGPLYNCSSEDVYILKVVPNEHYLLRLVNAALDQELFFTVANHNLTVVEIDGDFTKPYTTDVVFLTPGQTTNVLLYTNQSIGRYYMGASPYTSANLPFQQTPALAILEYRGSKRSPSPVTPTFPQPNDTARVNQYSTSLRSLADTTHPEPVPQIVDRNLFLTVGLGSRPCDLNRNCQGPSGTKFAAAISNNSFVLPDIALLQAYFFNISGVFTRDFPDNPPHVFNYTGIPPSNITPDRGTKVLVIPYDANVQMVFQGTSILGAENHPIHVHGYSFYIVGQGTGNYNPSTDPSSFNLFDPPRRNTVGVPVGGWAAIRFKADNPGVWYIHCHLEVHTTWGLTMAFIVLNGPLANQTLPPPPADLPQC